MGTSHMSSFCLQLKLCIRCVCRQSTVTKFRVPALTEGVNHWERLLSFLICYLSVVTWEHLSAVGLEAQCQEGTLSERLSQTYCGC